MGKVAYEIVESPGLGFDVILYIDEWSSSYGPFDTREDAVTFATANGAEGMGRQTLRKKNAEEIREAAEKLIRSVNALRQHPERPPVTTPILVTRGKDVPDARGILMPITVE